MRFGKGALLATASLLVFAPAQAHAWSFWDLFGGSSAPQRTQHTARLRVLYNISPNDDGEINGTFPAAGLRVGVFTSKSFWGNPEIISAAQTGTDGVVTLTYSTSDSDQVSFRFETDGDTVKTFPGAWNLFHTPHRSDWTVSNEDSHRDITYDLTWGGTFNNALGVHSAGFHARAYGSSTLSGLAPNLNEKVTYSYPGWINFGTTYTPFEDRVVVVDTPYMRAQGTVFHETGHTFWYDARGGAEYYWPLKHSLTEASGNPNLAMSEGFADFFEVLVKDRFGAIQGRPEISNHQASWLGEVHYGRYHTDIPFASWGDDNETNVACALYDLVDMSDDDQGLVAGYTDHCHLDSLESGVRAIYNSVRQNTVRDGSKIRMNDFWNADLRWTFGAAGEDALRMNGVSPY